MSRDKSGYALAALTAFGMLVGGIMWLTNVSSTANAAYEGVEKVRVLDSQFIDRLARIEEDTKAIRQILKHKQGE